MSHKTYWLPLTVPNLPGYAELDRNQSKVDKEGGGNPQPNVGYLEHEMEQKQTSDQIACTTHPSNRDEGQACCDPALSLPSKAASADHKLGSHSVQTKK